MDWLDKFYSLYQKYQNKFTEEEKKLAIVYDCV